MQGGYDYIVIGSGSSGAVVAARLSEDPAASVLLLEAGGRDRHPLQLMPLAFPRVALGRIGTLQFESEPEPGLYGRSLGLPRGRTLGGTSSINAMIAVRGNRRDFDDWAAQGLSGWSFADVLPYFKRLETHWRGAGPYHGGEGPVRISPMEGPNLLWEPLLDAAKAAGIEWRDDINGAEQDGISRMESTAADGRRVSSARAYLYPAMRRANLTIETGAVVSRIKVRGGRAVGVEYAKRGRTVTVAASSEVILSAGAYNSPQVLMLSGIGRPDDLREHGIDTVHELSGVGRNLADHPVVINEYDLIGEHGLTRHLRADRAALAALRWFAGKPSPFGYTGTMANVFARSTEGLDRPDMQMMCLPLSSDAKVWLPGVQGKPISRLSVRTGYLRLKSRGWVRLRSADPRAAPRIFLNLFSQPGDLDGMVRSLHLSRSIYAQSPLKDMIARERFPGPECRTEAELADFVRRNATHRAHPASSCRMGTDPDAVVDAELRVHGLTGLRVADASVLPSLPCGNPNLACMMIGEKAADMIRGRSLPSEHPVEPPLSI